MNTKYIPICFEESRQAIPIIYGVRILPTSVIDAGWLYLVAFMDWFSRYVLAWELDCILEVDFVLEALNKALQVEKPEIVNSDQGSQFTSQSYTEILLDKRVKVSMDGRGRAMDNIFTERLWRTVKYQEVYLNDYDNPREARRGLARFFEKYNTYRPHQALKNLTRSLRFIMRITRLMILSNPAFVILIFSYSTVKGKDSPLCNFSLADP